MKFLHYLLNFTPWYMAGFFVFLLVGIPGAAFIWAPEKFKEITIVDYTATGIVLIVYVLGNYFAYLKDTKKPD